MQKNKNNIRRKKNLSLYVFAALIVIFAAGYSGYKSYSYFFLNKKVFKLKKIEIIGKNISNKEKNKIIAQSGLFKNENLININLKKLSRLAASYRWVKNVTVYRKFPDAIVIVIKKRKIFAMVVYKNKLYYVSKTGYIIGKAGVHSGYGYPVITGLNTDNSGVYFKKLKKALSFLKISSHSILSGLRGEIHVEKDDGIALYTRKGLCIKFGIGNYRNKLKTLKKLFLEINAIHIRYKNYINLEYKNEAVIKVNKGSRVLPAGYKAEHINSGIFK
ncbi:MAG: FtsQ-type POTRA domain-containing protein [Deltaproteobacteria bacterium]|nr:FtsQ-type POTRA domain-containing protein [Deltaproteobacteria bacterium]